MGQGETESMNDGADLGFALLFEYFGIVQCCLSQWEKEKM